MYVQISRDINFTKIEYRYFCTSPIPGSNVSSWRKHLEVIDLRINALVNLPWRH